MLEILLASLSIMIISIIGVIFTWKSLSDVIERNLGLLVSFSAGVFSVVVFSLGSEVFEHSASPSQSFMWIMAGVIGVTILMRVLPGFHHHHDDKQSDHDHCHIDPRKIIVSDVVHNAGDGVLLAAAFAISLPIGIAATLSILVHELIQEISEFFVLRQSGLSAKKSIVINFVASSAILVGAIVGYFLIENFDSLEVPILGISAGSFIVVIIQDLIPESIRHSKKKQNYFKHILLFLLGILLMYAITQTLGH